MTKYGIEDLKDPDILRNFCNKTLGQGKKVGQLMLYRCPWGVHTRLKLEVAERDGVGVAMCRACNRGGTVFDVAAGVLGLDGKSNFPAVVQSVADTVGYALRDSGAEKTQKRRRNRKTRFFCSGDVSGAGVPIPAIERPLVYLPPDKEAAALEAVRRAASSPDSLSEWASRLGLPLDVMNFHTDIQEAGPCGLLGLDEKGRLLYVYTHVPADGEPVRVLGIKTRNPEGVQPRFLMTGSKQAPWGWDAVDSAGVVFVTEGESDALAVRAALWEWLEVWVHNMPDSYPEADELPAVVAKPDAGTFRAEWAYRLKGKDVELVADNDDAGRRGAEKTAEILRAAGVRRVFLWTPPAGVKDARAALAVSCPWQMANDLIMNRKEIKK